MGDIRTLEDLLLAVRATERPRGKDTQAKVGLTINFFDEDDWLPMVIRGFLGLVSQIVIVVSTKGYTGLPRTVNHDDFLRDLQKKSTRVPITILRGDWGSELAQRQAGLNFCRGLGLNFAFTVDGDEVIDHGLAEKILRAGVRGAGNVSAINHTYFKMPIYRVYPPEKNTMVLLTRLTPRTRCLRPGPSGNGVVSDRRTSEGPFELIGEYYHHFSWVRRSEQQILRKVMNHPCIPEARKQWWYNCVWTPWTPESRCFHPVNPAAYLSVTIVPSPLGRFNRNEQPQAPIGPGPEFGQPPLSALSRLGDH